VYALSLDLDRGQETANANRIIAFINFSEKGRRIASEDRLFEWEADVR
jgi:hypothetical protein